MNKLARIAWIPTSLVVAVAYFDPFGLADQAFKKTPVPVSVEAATSEVCDKVRQALPNPKIALRPTLFLPLEGDHEGVVRDALEDSLSREGRYRSVNKGVLDQVLEKVGLDDGSAADGSRAVELARAAEAEVVLFGSIRRLSIEAGSAELEVQLTAIDVEKGQPLLEAVIGNVPDAKPEPVSPSTPSGRAWQYLLLAAFVLLWPIALTPVSQSILKAEHNGLTAFALLAMISVPVIAFGSLLFAAASSVMTIVIFVLGALAAAAWCVYFTNLIAGQT